MEKNIGGGYVYTESDSSASYADEGFSVESLNDVEVTNPENGQVLVYDSESGKWVNGSGGGGGGGGSNLFVVGYTFDPESGKRTCDKTAQQIAQAIMGGSAVVLIENASSVEYNTCFLRQILLFEYDNSDPEDFYGSMLTINGSGAVITWTIDSADSCPFTQLQV